LTAALNKCYYRPMRKAAVLLALFLTPIQAFAAKDCATSFLVSAQAIPNQLSRLGYDRVGGIDLSTLNRSMSAIQVMSVKREKIKAANRDGWSDGRSTARWQVDGNGVTISVACEWWGRLPSKNLLALHEYLCAMGYNDDEYEISSAFWLLSQPLAQAHLTDEEKNQVEQQAARQGRQQFARGGVVGVGGGGEGVSVLARIMTMERGLKRLSTAQDEATRQSAIRTIDHGLNSRMTMFYQ
jgi:hypothetical protein